MADHSSRTGISASDVVNARLQLTGSRMTTNMISAARLIAHKTVNGRYQSRLQMDQFPVLGHQMTVSLEFD